MLKKIRMLDIIIVFVALAVAIVMIISPGRNDKKLKRLLLISGKNSYPMSWKNGVVDLKKIINRDMYMEVLDGKARISQSSCPDKICVNSGWISDCGHMIACMPNGVALIIDCSEDIDVTNLQ